MFFECRVHPTNHVKHSETIWTVKNYSDIRPTSMVLYKDYFDSMREDINHTPETVT